MKRSLLLMIWMGIAVLSLAQVLTLRSQKYIPITPLGDELTPKASFLPVELSYDHSSGILKVLFVQTKREYLFYPQQVYGSQKSISRYIVLEDFKNRCTAYIVDNPQQECDLTLSLYSDKEFARKFRSYHYRYTESVITGFEDLFQVIPFKSIDTDSLMDILPDQRFMIGNGENRR